MARSGNSLKKLNTKPSGAPASPAKELSRKSNRLQDAVYREMFLLESRRPGAEMGLALALLRAMVASDQMANCEEIRDWLATICPHCLKMIESALSEYGTCAPCPSKSVVPVTPIKQ
jgi:hypothetical protein